MSDSAASSRHIDQSIPIEWRAVQLGDRTLIVRLIPEASVEAFLVSAPTQNVRSLARADAALYEGKVVEPFFDEPSKLVEFQHDYAGSVGRHTLHEWLDEPAIRLKRLPSADLEEVL